MWKHTYPLGKAFSWFRAKSTTWTFSALANSKTSSGTCVKPSRLIANVREWRSLYLWNRKQSNVSTHREFLVCLHIKQRSLANRWYATPNVVARYIDLVDYSKTVAVAGQPWKPVDYYAQRDIDIGRTVDTSHNYYLVHTVAAAHSWLAKGFGIATFAEKSAEKKHDHSLPVA